MMSKEEFEHLYFELDMTQEEIARKFNKGTEAVQELRKEYGIKTKRERRKENQPDKDKLKELYFEENMSYQDIADKYGYCKATVRYWFDKFNIKSRQKIREENKPNKNELYNLYWEKGLKDKEIAKKFNVHYNTVRRWRNKYNIKSRKMKKHEYGEKVKPGKNKLKELHYNQRLTQPEIANKFNVTLAIVKRWFYEYNIEGIYGYDSKTIQNKVLEETDGKLKLMNPDNFNNVKDYLYFKCSKCGLEFKKQVTKIIHDNVSCPNSSSSKGERKIIDILRKYNIDFEKEYIFDDFISNNGFNYKYDFGILLNEELKAIVEYDGAFHYEPIEYFGGEERFEIRQRNDEIKDNYCKENNIPLIRIPYWDYENIEEIIKNKILPLIS